MRGIHYIGLAGAFALIYAVYLGMVAWPFPPQSIYERTEVHQDAPDIDLNLNEPFSWEFVAPGARLATIHFYHVFSGKKSAVRIRVENVTRGEELGNVETGFGVTESLALPPGIRKGDRIRVTYEVEASQRDRWPDIAQAVKRAHQAPYEPLEIRINGEVVSPEEVARERLWPLFLLQYRSPLGFLQWGWPVLLAGLGVLHGRGSPGGRLVAGALLVTGLWAAQLSLDGWFHRYSFHWTYADPDAYGKYGEMLGSALSGDAEAAQWIRTYAHAHAPLTALVVMLGALVGVPMFGTYAWWAACSSFGVVLMTHWFLTRRLEVSHRTALLAVMLLTFHVIFLKAFSKVSTDPNGMFWALAAMILVWNRLGKRASPAMDLLFGLVLLGSALARPAGVAMALFFASLAWVVDLIPARRTDQGWQLAALTAILLPVSALRLEGFMVVAALLGGGWLWVNRRTLEWGGVGVVIRPLRYLAPLVVIYGGAFLLLGWEENVRLNFEKAEEYKGNSSLEFFVSSFLITLVPLLVVVGSGWEGLKRPVVWVCLVVALGLIELLIAFQAPLYTRLFLPALPPVVVLAAVWIDPRVRRAPLLPFGVSVLIAGLGCALVQWQLRLPTVPPDWIARWIFF